MANWKRPEKLEYPKTYLEFEGKVVKDGKRRKYWIQDLTEEYFEEVIHNYVNGFMLDEPLCTFTKCYEDPISKKDFGDLWLNLLNAKLSLICLSEDESGKIQIAGFNCLYLAEDDNKEYKVCTDVHAGVLPEKIIRVEYLTPSFLFKLESPRSKQVINLVDHLLKVKNPFKEFNVAHYLGAMGLYVLREFRGEGLGQILIGAREQLCKEMGIKMSMTVFTSFISQKQADRAGFKDYATVVYEELPEELAIPNIHTHSKYCKFMYRIY